MVSNWTAKMGAVLLEDYNFKRNRRTSYKSKVILTTLPNYQI